MAEKQRAKHAPEPIDLTEMLVLHGDSLRGSDREKEQKLEKIKDALHERDIDFVDQPDALEIWVGTDNGDEVVDLLSAMGYAPDVYQI